MLLLFWTIKQKKLIVPFVANGFHGCENNCFRKIQKYSIFCPFFLFLAWLLPIPKRGRIPHFRRSRKTQLNIIWGPNYGLMISTVLTQILVEFLFVVSTILKYISQFFNFAVFLFFYVWFLPSPKSPMFSVSFIIYGTRKGRNKMMVIGD